MSIGIETGDKIGSKIPRLKAQLQIMVSDHQAEKALLPFSVEEATKKDEKTTTEASVKVSFLFRCSILVTSLAPTPVTVRR